jgi:hypothetical protein
MLEHQGAKWLEILSMAQMVVWESIIDQLKLVFLLLWVITASRLPPPPHFHQ